MTRQTRHLAGAFAAMLFVGLSWGANLPVTKVMLLHFDLIPMAAVRTLAGGAILSSSSLFGRGSVTFGGGEIILLFSNALWTLYSLKAQAWFDRASQLHRAYVASLSAMGWLIACSLVLIALGSARSP